MVRRFRSSQTLTDLANGGPTVQQPMCVSVKLDIAELNRKLKYKLHARASVAPPSSVAEKTYKFYAEHRCFA